MTNPTSGGVSKRSLVLLGAFAALALNRDVRRSLVQGTRDAVSSAQDAVNTAQVNLHTALDETVKPALSSAAQQAGQTLETIREDAPGRAQSLLGTAQEVAGSVAAAAAARAAQARKEAEKAAKRARKEYGPRLSALSEDLRDTADQARKEAEKAAQRARNEYVPRLSALGEDLRDAADDRRYDAQKAIRQARKSGRGLIGNLGQKASTLLDDAASSLQDEREDIEYRVARARRQAEKELRRSGKKWNAKKLQKAVDHRTALIQKEAAKQIALLEKRDGRRNRRAAAGGGSGALLVLSAGAIALARIPAARQTIMDAVSSVSPEAADKLHGVGQQIRGIVGDFWVQREGMSEGAGSKGIGAVPSHLSPDPASAKADHEGPRQAADKNGSPTQG